MNKITTLINIMEKYTTQDKEKFDKLMWNKESDSEIEKNFYKKTEKYIKFIKWIPGIKMIGIWNSISMNSATKNSDIDLLIVTDNNKMWLVRILVTLIFQILWVRKTSKKHSWRFCLSFFCTLKWLNFWKFKLEKDPYLYFWILYFKPILDFKCTYNIFLEKNNWANFSNFENIFRKNKEYIKYYKQPQIYNFLNIWEILNKIFKKIFLPKTLKSYKKNNKSYWIIINDNLLKFHNWDIRKEIAKKMW